MTKWKQSTEKERRFGEAAEPLLWVYLCTKTCRRPRGLEFTSVWCSCLEDVGRRWNSSPIRLPCLWWTQNCHWLPFLPTVRTLWRLLSAVPLARTNPVVFFERESNSRSIVILLKTPTWGGGAPVPHPLHCAPCSLKGGFMLPLHQKLNNNPRTASFTLWWTFDNASNCRVQTHWPQHSLTSPVLPSSSHSVHLRFPIQLFCSSCLSLCPGKVIELRPY